MAEVSLVAALLAGIASFLSPCVLPLVPGYLSWISGLSLEEMQQAERRRAVTSRVAVNSLAFILGFSLVFILLGASATAAGQFLVKKIAILTQIGGVVIIIFGLHIAGVFRIKSLYREKRFQVQRKPVGLLGALLVGVAFAFGWTPCVGPILAGILAYAATRETLGQGVLLLIAYSVGLGLPLFLSALAINTFLEALQRIKRYFRAIEIASGCLLVVIGILILTKNLGWISAHLTFLERFSL